MTHLDSLREKLLAEKKLLETELGKLGILADKESGDWEAVPQEQVSGPEADENDLSDRFEDFEERSATVDELEKRLLAVNEAFARMEAGTYGVCKICGKEIEEARLGANPAAATCIEHKEL